MTTFALNYDALRRDVWTQHLRSDMQGSRMTWRENVLGLRAALGWTQVKLAAELQVTVSTVYRWENSDATPLPIMRKVFAELAARHGLKFPGVMTEAEQILAVAKAADATSTDDTASGG